MNDLDIWGMPVVVDAAAPPNVIRFQDQLPREAPSMTMLEIVSGPETCHHCGGPTQRTGTCHTCIVCGSTTGCG